MLYIIAVIADVVGFNGTRSSGNDIVFGKFFVVIQFKHVYAYHSDIQSTLTLNVRGPSLLGLTRSISWLLMPWLFTSPGHQQP